MNFRHRLYRIVFFSDTKAGKVFDLTLLYLILINFFVVVVLSIPTISNQTKDILFKIEWAFTILFSLEYIVRILVNPKPLKYIFSIWGIIDLVSIIPAYLGLWFGVNHAIQGIRIIRLLRAYRILKLTRFAKEADLLSDALISSLYKIVVFMIFMFVMVIMLGTIMYVVEEGNPGFSSIPQSIYWAIVTVTTVGFGDVVPITIFGKFLASIIMLLGYVIIAVPTGITAVEYGKTVWTNRKQNKICAHCSEENNYDANFCSKCGNQFAD